MDENLLHQKLDQIVADLTEIKVTHAADMGEIRGTMRVNTQSLQDHMRRTVALEIRVEQVDAASEARDKPLEDQLARTKGIWWFIGAVAVALGIAAGVKALL